MILTGNNAGVRLDGLSVNNACNSYLQRTSFITEKGDTALHGCARSYDPDGNLTDDGRWHHTGDDENRLPGMIRDMDTPSGARQKLAFEYDWQGRRIRKQFFTYCSGWVERSDLIFQVVEADRCTKCILP